MLTKSLFILALGLAGCTTGGHTETTAADGRAAFESTCNGGGKSFQDCAKEASAACSGKYEVLDKDQTTLQPVNTTAPEKGGYVSAVENRSMVYRCTNVAH